VRARCEIVIEVTFGCDARLNGWCRAERRRAPTLHPLASLSTLRRTLAVRFVTSAAFGLAHLARGAADAGRVPQRTVDAPTGPTIPDIRSPSRALTLAVIAFVLLGVLQGMMPFSVALAGGGILGVLARKTRPTGRCGRRRQPRARPISREPASPPPDLAVQRTPPPSVVVDRLRRPGVTESVEEGNPRVSAVTDALLLAGVRRVAGVAMASGRGHSRNDRRRALAHTRLRPGSDAGPNRHTWEGRTCRCRGSGR
jgi:hypothetical protein